MLSLSGRFSEPQFASSRRKPVSAPAATGFTLVEILIVVSIIAILLSLVVGGLAVARQRANVTIATQMVSTLSTGLDRFYDDEGYYPGMKVDPDVNAFPELFEALLGDKKPKGKGGRSAPYVEVKEDQIRVWDDVSEEYRKATFDERWDPEIPKFVIDPWGEPYWYRANKRREREEYMGRPEKFDIWSLGPDRLNHSIPGAVPEPGEKSDDIGNW